MQLADDGVLCHIAGAAWCRKEVTYGIRSIHGLGVLLAQHVFTLFRMEELVNIADKIKALMAKTVSNGCTEDEALAAAAKVKELLEKYKVELGDVLESYTAEWYSTSLETRVAERLGQAVCRYCRVSALKAPYETGVVFIGPKSGVIFAEWLVPTLVDYVMRATEDHMKSYARGLGIGDTKREKRSFAIGCAARIAERLNEAAGEWNTGTYLVPWAEKNNLKIVKGKAGSTGSLKNSALTSGRQAGDGARFDCPLEGGAEIRRLS